MLGSSFARFHPLYQISLFLATQPAREIRAGEEIVQQIDIHLNAAHIILLLISANFLASAYCYSQEMMRALQRHERGEAHVIPVLLRPVLFTDTPFAKLQPLPTNRNPVVNWRIRDSAFVDSAVGIEHVVQECLFLASRMAPAGMAPYGGIEARVPGLYNQEHYNSPNQSYQSPPYVPLLPPRVPSRSRRGLILVALSVLGLLSIGVLLVLVGLAALQASVGRSNS
jgi:TIR domain